MEEKAWAGLGYTHVKGTWTFSFSLVNLSSDISVLGLTQVIYQSLDLLMLAMRPLKCDTWGIGCKHVAYEALNIRMWHRKSWNRRLWLDACDTWSLGRRHITYEASDKHIWHIMPWTHACDTWCMDLLMWHMRPFYYIMSWKITPGTIVHMHLKI